MSERKFSHYLIRRTDSWTYLLDNCTYGPRAFAHRFLEKKPVADNEEIVTVYVRKVPKKPKPRDFGWAWKQMVNGHSVRRSCWFVGRCIRLCKEDWANCRAVKLVRPNGYEDRIINFPDNDLVAEDWELA